MELDEFRFLEAINKPSDIGHVIDHLRRDLLTRRSLAAPAELRAEPDPDAGMEQCQVH